jgi:hypothetical protein
MKKSQNMLVWLRKIVLASASFHRQFGVAGESHSNAEHLQKRV